MSELFDIGDDKAVCCNPGGRFHGWLFRRHPDGQWVSVRKLESAECRSFHALHFVENQGFHSRASSGGVVIVPLLREIGGICDQAADEIERLRAALSNSVDVQLKLQAEIERLREALRDAALEGER